MKSFYAIAWLLLSAIVAWYMWNSSTEINSALAENNSPAVEVIDEVSGSSYTQSEDQESGVSDTNDSTDNSDSQNDESGDFRKEGKERADFLEQAFIEFENNKFTLPKSQKFNNYIDSISVLLKEGDYYVELVGHNDTNPNQDSYAIGLKRANYIKGLLSNKGVSESKIKVESKGDEEPREDGDSPEARSKNRRVELFLKPN